MPTIPPPPKGFRLVNATPPPPPPGFTLVGADEPEIELKLPDMSKPAVSMEEVATPSGTLSEIGRGLVRGATNTVLSVPRALSRLPGGLQDDLSQLGTTPTRRPIEPQMQTPVEASIDENIAKQKRAGEVARGVLQAEQTGQVDTPTTTLGKFAEMFGSTVPYLAAGAAGAPAAAALGVIGGTEEALTRADQSGVPLTPEQRALAAAGGAVIGSTEAVPIGRLVGTLKAAGVASKSVDEGKLLTELYPKWKDYLKSAGIQAAEEGIQEAGAGVAQDVLEASYGGRPSSRIGENIVGDVMGGGGVGALLDVMVKVASTRLGRARLRADGIDPEKLRTWVQTAAAQSPDEFVDIDESAIEGTTAPAIAAGATPGKPQPGQPPKGLLERPPIAAPPVGGMPAEPEPNAPFAREGVQYTPQPDGSVRGVQRPRPGVPPAGYLEKPPIRMGPVSTQIEPDQAVSAEASAAEEIPPPPAGFELVEPATSTYISQAGAEAPATSIDVTPKADPDTEPEQPSDLEEKLKASLAQPEAHATVPERKTIDAKHREAKVKKMGELLTEAGISREDAEQMTDSMWRQLEKAAGTALKRNLTPSSAETRKAVFDLLPAAKPAEKAADLEKPAILQTSANLQQTAADSVVNPLPKDGQKVDKAEEPEKHSYSSTQVNLPAPVAKRVIEAGARIPDSQMAEQGRETEPHVTVKYGLHGSDADEVRQLLADEGPVTVKLGKASVFPNTDNGDVLKVEVESEDLHRLNAKIADALPNTDTFPEYKPHVTIAYLKPGEGEKYAGKPIPGVSGQEMTLDSIKFSPKEGEAVEIPLSGAKTEEPAAKEEPTKLLIKSLRTGREEVLELPPVSRSSSPAPARPEKMSVTGDTYRHKFLIKTLPGAVWNKPKQAWMVDDTPSNRAAIARIPKLVMSQPKPEPAATKPAPVETKVPVQSPATERILDQGAPPDARERTEIRETDTPRTPDREPLERAPAADVSGARTEGPAPEVDHRGAGTDVGRADGSDSRRSALREGVADDSGAVGVSAGRADETDSRPRPGKFRERTGEGAGAERDYRITEADQLGAGSDKQKFKDNLEALRALKLVQSEKREATPEEKKKLVKYVGWGSLAQKAFTWRHSEFDAHREELKALLTPEEYEAARASSKNAHYTTPDVIKGMWDAMRRLGMQADSRVLEPSAGIGHFLGLQPDDLMGKRIAVELDPTTAAILKLLYPGANTINSGYEKAPLPNNYFDVAISNVPFGPYGVVDNTPAFKRKHALTKSIHNYFFAKALEQVRPGGVVAFVTSSFTMDAADTGVRRYLASKADLLGAIRLPGGKKGAFAQNAGTEVTTDIIFLRKRAPQTDATGPAWTNLGTVQGPDPTDKIVDIQINEYFVAHPEMMLGEMAMKGEMYGPEGSRVLLGELTPEKLAAAIANLPEGALTYLDQSEAFNPNPIAELPDPNSIKDGGYGIKDGTIIRREGSTYRTADLFKQDAERVRGLIGVRDALREVYRTQLNLSASENEVTAARAQLNTVYDQFVKKHGFISKRENVKAYSGDPDLPFLLAIEDWDNSAKTAKKRPVFFKRTIDPYRPIESVDNAKDALTVTLAERGRIDWIRMKELYGGKPITEIQEELGDLIFENPEGGWETADEYLSGEVREKLRTAQAIAENDDRYKRNVEALKAVQPRDLTPGQIKGRLGSPWIPESDIQQFIQELLNVQYPQLGDVVVDYSPQTGSWGVRVSDRVKNLATNTTRYGMEGFSATDMIEMALNLKAPTLYKEVPNDSGKGTKRVKDPEASLVAQVKQNELKERFEKWIWKDVERTERLTTFYNENFNNLVLRKYDGSHLKLPGMARLGLRNQNLDRHQLDAIWRNIQNGNTLLAHTVGAGKTFTMIATGMELKRIGLIKKPAYIVPNHLVGQWAKDFLTLYPGANIFVADKETFNTGNRQLAASRIASGNYDAVILSHKSFEFLPVGDATYQKFFDSQMAEINDALNAAEAAEASFESNRRAKSKSKRKSPTVKALETAKARLETLLEKRTNRDSKDKTIDFEELGIDQLFVDEADLYKNLFYVTKMDRVAGMPQSNSNRAMDMFLKTQYLGERTNWRGVTFATGTPISNAVAELYTMQRYLQMPYLKQHNLDSFDNWAQSYGEIETTVELKPEGTGFRTNRRFSKFVNVPELLTAFRTFADVKNADELKLPVPALAGGKVMAVVSPMRPELKAFTEHLGRRADAIRTGKVEPEDDNMLKIVHEGRMAALDIRLMLSNAADDPESKVNKLVRNVTDIHRETSGQNSAQMIFLDMSIPKTGKETKSQAEEDAELEEGGATDEAEDNDSARLRGSVYEDIRAKLVKQGIPAKEIAFIHDAKTNDQKQTLFDDVNAGRVRVLIGSTEKMGAGTNAQRKLIALHDLDIPWRPRDLEQRHGRILRQGNENPEVRIFQYLNEGSFDAYMYQGILSKSKFIGRAMSGDLSVREIEDVGTMVPTAAEFMALSTGDPLIMERVKLDQEIKNLQLLESGFEDEKFNTRREIAKLEREARELEIEAELKRRSLKQLQAFDKDKPPLVLDGFTPAKEKKEPRGEDLKAAILAAPRKGADLGTFKGLPISVGEPRSYVKKTMEGEQYLLTSRTLYLELGGRSVTVATVDEESNGGSVLATLTRDTNEESLSYAVEVREKWRGEKLTRLADLQKEDLDKPFPKAERLKEARERLEWIDAEFKRRDAEEKAKNGNKSDDEAGFAAADILGAHLVAKGLEAAADARTAVLGSMGERIRQASPTLAASIQKARDVGDVMAGGFVNRLTDAQLDQLTQPERALLLDALEGRARRAPRRVADSYRVIRGLTRDIASILDSLGDTKGLDALPKILQKALADKKPTHVLAPYLAQTGERIAKIAEFGVDDKKITAELKAIAAAGGNAKQVKEWVDRIFERPENTPEERITRVIRSLQAFKLGLALIPNATQAIANILPAADTQALAAGYRALLTAEGRRFAVESGASIEPVLAEAHQQLDEGIIGKVVDKFLTPFQLVEQHNRIVAANAGADFAARMWQAAQGNTRHAKWAARKVRELGVDPTRPLHRADLLMAAKKFADQTQFRTRPENLPVWTTSTWGKVMFQFKTFAYQQARFMLRQTVGELRDGSPLRAGRNVVLMALLSGALGELVRLLRAALTNGWERWEEDNEELTTRILKDIAGVGAAGMMLDFADAVGRGKEATALWFAGPGVGMGIDAAVLGHTLLDTDKDVEEKGEAGKKFVYRHAPLGSVINGIAERE